MFQVDVKFNARITMRDGIELSANLWCPIAPHTDRVFPAILEMIPYRKDDWRYVTDHQHGTYFAQRGYVFCRVDVRGTGSSQGIALDEYTPQETQDGYDVVEWLAAQEWCNGHVGMWGISYGGFTSIQVAMLQPPHLKAIVPMYATDDRYTDDVHYIGGCVTASELAQYAVSQIAMNAMPPKAEYAPGNWASEWKDRLEHTPPWLIEWLRHQTDGPYWRSGSLAPDYARIKCAIFNIGGWNDEYTNSVLRMQAHCINAPRKGLIGNWVHSFPEDAYPGPNLDWLHEMTRFFDYWLKGLDNGVMAEPPLTVLLREYTSPEAFPKLMNGHWHSEAAYPIERLTPTAFYLGKATLTPDPSPTQGEGRDTLEHRPTLGTHAALCFGGGVSPNGLARDLRPDEALSLTYTTDPLDEPIDILGLPEAILHVSSIAPVAYLVVRLTDVAPDGVSSHVTSGILNLTHRDGHTQPKLLETGQIYEVRVELKATGYRFLTGHRIRLSVATAYW
ncbi:MAG TPA: CocE/NonD family hydrolase, partial [Anaerolineae bacterium]|nr:CocE/NonD family hydrolase [Anaerolineae bacterium]